MDININQAEVLPRSGIPIAAGLENVYISLAGLIGAGKTTRQLCGARRIAFAHHRLDQLKARAHDRVLLHVEDGLGGEGGGLHSYRPVKNSGLLCEGGVRV